MADVALRFPPPLIPTAVIGIAIAADFFFNIPHLPVRLRLLGLPWLLAGLGLIAWAFIQLRRAKTPVAPWEPTTAIVESGPYAQSRNPIYLGFVVVQLGVGLLLGSLSVLIGVTASVALLDRFVVRKEESYLAAKFGETYEDYRRRVRRWM